MALSNAEKQRRYRERHVMVPRDAHPKVALASPDVCATPRADLDLTAVRAALADARHVLANTSPYPSTMARQIQQVFVVLEHLVEALDGLRGS